MRTLFENGHIVDLIVGLMLLEVLALGLWYRKTRRGVAPLKLAANFLAGAFLLFGLRAALLGWDWQVIATLLTGAFLAHGADLASRWISSLEQEPDRIDWAGSSRDMAGRA